MKKYSLLLFLLSTITFFSCGENTSEETPKENGITVEIKASYTDFLLEKMDYQTRSELWAIILKSNQTHLESNKDFWECFKEQIILDTLDYRLSAILTNTNSTKKFMKLSNEEIINELRHEFDMEISRCMVILEARLKSFGATHIDVTRSGANYFKIIAYNIKDKDRFAKIIQSHANVGFFETMENMTALNEILRLTNKVYERDSIAGIPFADSYLEGKPNSFFPRGFIFNIVMYNGQQALPPGAQVGMAKWGDTSYFNQFTRDTIITSRLPKLVHFLWGWKDDENGFPLFVIKSNNLNRPEVSSEYITDARVNNSNGNIHIEITFNYDGAEKFRKLTQKNINKAIAIVMDGKVISAPLVQQEISGGTSVISGNFSLQEAEDLANILKAGNMPMRLEVVKMKKIK